MPTSRRVPALVAAFVAGGLLALQSRVNGTLAESTGALPAALASFGSGLALLCALLLLVPGLRRALGRVRQAVRGARLPRWQLLGGVAGGLLVATQATAVPLVGVSTFLVAVVGGQLLGSVWVDHRGVGPRGAQRVTVTRVGAAVLALVGVVVTVAAEGLGAGPWWPVPAAVLVGSAMAVQQATNGQVTAHGRAPLTTAWLNFTTGTATLLLLLVVALLTGVRIGAAAPAAGTPSWWAWTGGLVGIAFIALAAWAVQHVGVLVFGLVTVAGQLLVALLVDLLVPATRDRVGVGALVGVLVVLAGAVLATRSEDGPSPPRASSPPTAPVPSARRTSDLDSGP